MENNNKIVIIDIETAGFKPRQPMLEVGIVELDLDTGEAKIIYDELVKEDHFNDGFKDSWIFKNSDLEFEDVMEAKPLDITAIQGILNNYPATAYNNRFDFSFLEHRGLDIEKLPCPMLIATNVCNIPGKYGKPKWPTVEEAYKFFFPDEAYIEKHRGADDALHEAKIVYELYKRGEFKINKMDQKKFNSMSSLDQWKFVVRNPKLINHVLLDNDETYIVLNDGTNLHPKSDVGNRSGVELLFESIGISAEEV